MTLTFQIFYRILKVVIITPKTDNILHNINYQTFKIYYKFVENKINYFYHKSECINRNYLLLTN